MLHIVYIDLPATERQPKPNEVFYMSNDNYEDHLDGLTGVAAPPIVTPQGTYFPFTDGYAVGFRFEQDGEPDQFIYLNPSGDSDDGQPNVFVYTGTKGDPSRDGPECFINIGKKIARCGDCGNNIIDNRGHDDDCPSIGQPGTFPSENEVDVD